MCYFPLLSVEAFKNVAIFDERSPESHWVLDGLLFFFYVASALSFGPC